MSPFLMAINFQELDIGDVLLPHILLIADR